MNTHTRKASLTTVGFAIVGLIGLGFVSPVTPEVLPDGIFYIVLVVNTFFSVRLFSKIIPWSMTQFLVDTVLILLYVGAAFAMGRPLLFPFLTLYMFMAAVFKYTVVLHGIPHNGLLKRKILIDLTGVVLCGVCAGLAVAGYPVESAWFAAIAFSLANLYLLLIRPMYRLE